MATTILVYQPASHFQFLNYDDNLYVTQNPQVRSELTWNTLRWSFTTLDAWNWHPATWLSHALDVQLFGVNAGAHHEINVLLHGINAVLLFLLLYAATGFAWRSLLVAALFALHPLNVGSICFYC